MLNKQKKLSYIELSFIVFTTNSVNLRRYKNHISNYDLFFYYTSIVICTVLILIYSIYILKKIDVFDNKMKITYLIVNFAILIFYLLKFGVYRDIFFMITIFLIGIKSLLFSFYFFYIKRINSK